ncbi:54S ribosomal protein L17 mitochondrial [Nowakowskiella sp. JEL0407]|nr:54S ribosomal protein L17 mitochondrial [Nowakowskiella sp. JEL0407]
MDRGQEEEGSRVALVAGHEPLGKEQRIVVQPALQRVAHYEGQHCTRHLFIMAARVGVLFVRGPRVSQPHSAFDVAYHSYRNALFAYHNEKHFPVDFYFKKGSKQEADYKAALKKDAKSDSPLATIGALSPHKIIQTLDLQKDELKLLKVRENITEDDKKGNVASLNRKLDENLYFVEKRDGKWRFLESELEGDEFLHQGAKRYLDSMVSQDSEFWIVGRTPVGFLNEKKKVFFMKSHWISGPMKLNGVKEFAWLTKDELKDNLDTDYYNQICDMV